MKNWIIKNFRKIQRIILLIWFIVTAYFICPITSSIQLSKRLEIDTIFVLYLFSLVVSIIHIYLSEKFNITINIIMTLINQFVSISLLRRLYIVNTASFIDSFIRSIATLAAILFIQRGRRTFKILKQLKNKEPFDQLSIYPNDVQKKVKNNAYRYLTKDERFWIKSQEDCAYIEWICSVCIIFYIIFISDEYFHTSTIFIAIISFIRFKNNKWVLVDEKDHIK